MLRTKVIAQSTNPFANQQKALQHAFMQALKPRIIVSAKEIQALSKQYKYPLNMILRFLQPLSIDTYSWRTTITSLDQVNELCPEMPTAIKEQLKTYFRQYHSPRRSLPYPHLTWHKQTQWIRLSPRFPIIGINPFIRPLTTYHSNRDERIWNLTMNRGTLGFVFHRGDTVDSSSMRLVAGRMLTHTRIFEKVFEKTNTMHKELIALLFQEKYTELTELLLKNVNQVVGSLGDTGFRFED